MTRTLIVGDTGLTGVHAAVHLRNCGHSITGRSMAEAIESALKQRRGGHAYLVGDENLTWKDYLELYFRAAGQPVDLPVSLHEHPLFPDIILYGGRNSTLHYEPEMGELAYSRNQVHAAIEKLVSIYS